MKIKPASMMILTVSYIVILAVIIFVASKSNTRYLLNFVGSIPYGDKLGHFFLMGFLSFLVNFLLQIKTIEIRKRRFLLGSIIVFLIITVEELSQIFVSGRTFDFSDLIANWLGILCFGELARLMYQKIVFH